MEVFSVGRAIVYRALARTGVLTLTADRSAPAGGCGFICPGIKGSRSVSWGGTVGRAATKYAAAQRAS